MTEVSVHVFAFQLRTICIPVNPNSEWRTSNVLALSIDNTKKKKSLHDYNMKKKGNYSVVRIVTRIVDPYRNQVICCCCLFILRWNVHL